MPNDNDKDKLEQYIQDHRPKLDIDKPAPGTWEHIQAGLEKDTSQKAALPLAPIKERKVYTLNNLLKVAAVLACMVIIGYYTQRWINENGTEKKPAQLAQYQVVATDSNRSFQLDSTVVIPSSNSLVLKKGIENINYEDQGWVNGNRTNAPSNPYTNKWEFGDGKFRGGVEEWYKGDYWNGEFGKQTGTYTVDVDTRGRVIRGGSWKDVGYYLDKDRTSNYEGFGEALTYSWTPDTYHYEQYDQIFENPFKPAFEDPLSTFSIDVDRAGYSNMRRFLNDHQLPQRNAVKIEEMINYFDYDYPEPAGEHPFSIYTELHDCPWNPYHQLLHVGIQGKHIQQDQLPPSNLTFLIDVSGSMDSPDKLTLLKASFKMLVKQMRPEDKVAIVVYAGAAGVVLEPTSGDQKEKILQALDQLNAGGSTAGGEGIELAYKTAQKAFSKKSNNRVILATDGDFNVGISDDESLVKLIEQKRKSGIFLSVLGFGTGNLQSSKMEKLADNGNGNYAYIDGLREANKVLVQEMSGTIHTIAKDVKLQLEFNPARVLSHRLIGYENRVMAHQDFDNDQKDAGELGAGHTVTALYEIIPNTDAPTADLGPERKYRPIINNALPAHEQEVMTIKFRYKLPDEDESKLIEHTLKAGESGKPSENFQFSAAVAEFGMLLRDSEYLCNAKFDQVTELAQQGKGEDKDGYRQEFMQLVEEAAMLKDASRDQ